MDFELGLFNGLAIFLVGVAASAMNSVAGGGKFLTFPALIFFGLSPLAANVTSSVALWPGAVSAAAAYRKEWMQQKEALPSLILASLLGSGVGGWILLNSPEKQFESLVPWLLLGATLIFTFGGRVLEWWKQRTHTESPALHRRVAPLFFQFLIGVYGGYFGAGIGILILAVLQALGLTYIHRMNALKMVLGSAVHSIAVILFVFSGTIVWNAALPLIAGAVAGGYAGAAIAQKCPPEPVRWMVTGIGLAMSVYFFWQ